ncbi:hypothetical protein [Herbiconiux solani]|uniref:hypothetical protein n=1 Tax=Herbiconiux solani TaxID=661329 RepID=UPI000825E098|nr:hypothetical protein [Herbiconiux solani]
MNENEEKTEAEHVHRIWHPLGDTPITVQMSREQLQIIQDALNGVHIASRGWETAMADELEKVLKASMEGDPS